MSACVYCEREADSLEQVTALSCISPDKKQPVPEWMPKRAAGLVTKERLVSFLTGDVLGLVHFATGALMDDSWFALS
jgi:hypothetical protein